MLRLPLFILCVYNFLVQTKGIGMLGPADLIFKRFTSCEEPFKIDNQAKVEVTQKKFNRTADVMDITVINPFEIDDSVEIELKGWMKKDGGFKPGSFYLKDTACKVLSSLLGDMFLDILHAAGTDNCPLPIGEHRALDFYFDNNKFTVPQLWGEYKMEIVLTKDGDLRSCYIGYYDLVDKNDRL